MAARVYAVYILATRKDGPLYIGITNNLARRDRRAQEAKRSRGMPVKYNIDRLIYVETFDEPDQAIEREKVQEMAPRLKDRVIEKEKPAWPDLAGRSEPFFVARDDTRDEPRSETELLLALAERAQA